MSRKELSRYVEKYGTYFVVNFMENTTVKEFLKSANIGVVNECIVTVIFGLNVYRYTPVSGFFQSPSYNLAHINLQ